MAILTNHSPNLREKIDQLWYQQSQILLQTPTNKFSTQLAKLGSALPVLLQLLQDAQQGCSLPLLHNMTLTNKAAIQLQLIIRQHEPNQAMDALLDLTPPAPPDECPISCAWQVTVAAVQVQMYYILCCILYIDDNYSIC